MIEKHLELVRPQTEMSSKSQRFQGSVPRKYSKRDLLREARHQFNAQAIRESVFDGLMFHEPGWDILLAIYIAEADGRRMDMPTIAQLINMSSTLLMRWIALLADQNLLTRSLDENDRGRVWLSLTPFGYEKTEACLQASVQPRPPVMEH